MRVISDVERLSNFEITLTLTLSHEYVGEGTRGDDCQQHELHPSLIDPGTAVNEPDSGRVYGGEGASSLPRDRAQRR